MEKELNTNKSGKWRQMKGADNYCGYTGITTDMI